MDVRRFDGDDDPIDSVPDNCTAGSPGGDVVQVYNCTGVTRVVASAGDLNDQIDASAAQANFGQGFDTRLLTIPIQIDLGDGDDFGGGGNAADIVNGGDGSDFLLLDISGGGGPGGAGGGADTGNGGAGNDFIQSGRGADTVDGGAGDDFVSGGPDNDTLRGGDGNDQIAGGPGSDGLFGQGGDDQMEGECFFFPCSATSAAPLGNDDFSGGSGLDIVFYWTTAALGADPPPFDPPRAGVKVTVTIDDQQNDGRAGEPADNVRTDVETVDLATREAQDLPPGSGLNPGSGDLTGSAGFNSFIGSEGNDTINPLGGNDVVNARGGNDVINTVDGLADNVTCGPGTDTANHDQFDIVADDCETRNLTNATAPTIEDKAPTVAWVAPASNAVLSNTTANVLQVNATDDIGISQVQFLDDERVVCVDTTAPYTCNYRPQGDDVGRNTLVAIAIDTSQQTATAVRNVRVPLFTAPKLSASTKPKRDSRSPFRFTTSGRLTLPTGVTPGPGQVVGGGGVSPGLGCKGVVTVQFKAGRKTISSRKATLRSNCTYSSKVTFRLPSRLHPRTLRVFVRFQGNDVVAAKNASRYTVRVR